MKKIYWRSDCESTADFESLVNKSASANVAVRYPAWCWRDWKSYLSLYFKAMQGVKKYQYFRMESTLRGIVVVKENRDADEIQINILKEESIALRELKGQGSYKPGD